MIVIGEPLQLEVVSPLQSRLIYDRPVGMKIQNQCQIRHRGVTELARLPSISTTAVLIHNPVWIGALGQLRAALCNCQSKYRHLPLFVMHL
jgi:hypothetical protein